MRVCSSTLAAEAEGLARALMDPGFIMTFGLTISVVLPAAREDRSSGPLPPEAKDLKAGVIFHVMTYLPGVGKDCPAARG